jgi:hypothetical protein
MALFKKVDLIALRKQMDLKKELLPLSLVFNELEKQAVAILLDELIAICDIAIVRDIEVVNPSLLS